MPGRWERRYAQLHEQLHCGLRGAPPPADKVLASWMQFQLGLWRDGRLAPER